MHLLVIIDRKVWIARAAKQRHSAERCHAVECFVKSCAHAGHFDTGVDSAAGQCLHLFGKAGFGRIKRIIRTAGKCFFAANRIRVGGNDRHGTGRMSKRHGKLAENAKSHH